MTWILIVYMVALVCLAANRERLPKNVSLGGAWIWFSLVPISRFVFALFRAGNLRNPKDLALVEIWADGIGWLFLGISFFCLSGLMMRGEANGRSVPPAL